MESNGSSVGNNRKRGGKKSPAKRNYYGQYDPGLFFLVCEKIGSGTRLILSCEERGTNGACHGSGIHLVSHITNRLT